MTFSRAFIFETPPMGNYGDARWFIEIEGTRESVVVRADPQGNFLSVSKQ